MRALKILAVAGLVGVGLFFAGPFILGLLYIVLCGGVATFGSVLGPIADNLEYVVSATFAVLALIVILVAVRFAKKHAANPELLNTEDNTFKKNATYIKGARAEGMSDEAIRAVFRNGGWSSEETDKAFALAATS